jgi:hypothetical protein
LIASGLIGAYFAFHKEEDSALRLDKEAQARVDNVEVVRGVDPVFGKEFTAYVVVTFSYEVNGTGYQRSAQLSSSAAAQYVPWSSAKVCYDPSDPATIENPRLFPSQYVCGR